MLKIKVFLLSDEKEESKTQYKINWENLFSDPIFDFRYTHLKIPYYPCDEKIYRENYIFYHILEEEEEEEEEEKNKDYILIIKNNSITLLDKDRLVHLCKKIICLKNWDLFYLSNWLDDCQENLVVECLDEGAKILKTFSPHGLQAILFSPRGIKKLLEEKKNDVHLERNINNLVKEEKLITYTIIPNIFYYDPGKISSEKDLAKFDHFIRKREDRHKREEEIYSIFWFVLFAVLFLTLILMTKMR